MDYARFGNGEKTFVIIPGLSIHSILSMKDAIEDAYAVFKEEYTVYVFDLEPGNTVEGMAEDTAAQMKKLGIKDADIFGASLGGMIAIYIAACHPELVHRMVLGSALAKADDQFRSMAEKWIRLAEERKEEELLESFVDNVYSEATLSEYRDYLISSNRGVSDEEYERFTVMASSCCGFDSLDVISEVKCPVLVLGSKGDRIVSPECAAKLALALGCDIYMYDGSFGHGVYDEAPDYKERLFDFFRGNGG